MKVQRFGAWQVLVSDLKNAPHNFILAAQEHGGIIRHVNTWQLKRELADGLVTTASQLAIAVITADCVPLVLMTATHAATLHVSRTSLIHGLLEKVPRVFPLADVSAIFIGPHICAQHFTFEYKEANLIQFIQKYPNAVTEDACIHLSLRQAIQAHLTQWNIVPQLVHEDGRCTYEDPSLYSYRRWREQQNAAPLPELITSVWKG